MDRIVAAAARHRIAVLANFSASARWASPNPTSPDYWRYPPAKPQDFADLFREAVRRYGPKGTFWAQNPGTPKVPIRKWQVWNEQMAPWYWVPRPWAPTYMKLLKAIVQGDPQGRPEGQGDRRLADVVRQLSPVGRRPRHVQARREALLRCDRAPSVHERQVGARDGQPDARDRPARADGHEQASRQAHAHRDHGDDVGGREGNRSRATRSSAWRRPPRARRHA